MWSFTMPLLCRRKKNDEVPLFTAPSLIKLTIILLFLFCNNNTVKTKQYSLPKIKHTHTHIYQLSDRSLYEASMRITSNNNHKIDLKCHKKTLTCNIQGPLISKGVLLCFNPWNHQNEAYFILQYTVLYCVQSAPVKVNLN